MNRLIFGLCLAFCAVTVWSSPLLGAKECTWGPTYWCKNITSAKSCNAVTHCIQTVWIHQKPKQDNDSVCSICLDMVAQARAQLESNETQEQLKEVFEGSCKLIPIKIIRKQCIKMVDEFVPELVETLASQMNPETVCSVAGLCNNAYIDKLLAEHTPEQKFVSLDSDILVNKRQQECENCYTVVNIAEKNLKETSRDKLLDRMLEECGRLGSFSDACSSLIIVYFNDIYARLKSEFSADSVCHIAGVCSAKYHKHETPKDVEIIPLSSVGVRPVVKDDLPCDLCSQLVGHFRDLLVANTTEEEFERVLVGVCKQTKSFKKECLSIVQEYYPMIYQFLVKELNGKELCSMIGICPRPEELGKMPIIPLLPANIAEKADLLFSSEELVGTDEVNSYKTTEEPKRTISYGDSIIQPEQMQLPIERLIPQTVLKAELTNIALPIDEVEASNRLGLDSKEGCALCEYVLHFIQDEISSDKSEANIKKVLDRVCDALPKSVDDECKDFVDAYGEALIALFVQEIDPSQVCPRLRLCSKPEVKDIEVLIHDTYDDKPNCPLCLFAVTKLENYVKNQKTEENIKKALHTLCEHLSNNLAAQCNDFVETYSKELIELLMADLNPQEVCVYLKLCSSDKYENEKGLSILEDIESGFVGEVLTNEIPDDTVNGRSLVSSVTARKPGREGPQCVICEYIMTEIEKELKDKNNDDEIKKVVHGICDQLPKTVSKDCNNFVDKYADTVIALLVSSLEPSEICSMMDLCKKKMEEIKNEIIECATCETVVETLEKLMNNPKVDHNVQHMLTKACNALPPVQVDKCKKLVRVYGPSMINLIGRLPNSHQVCAEIDLCGKRSSIVEMRKLSKRQLVGAEKCTRGPSYWCASHSNAKECQTTKYCYENGLLTAEKAS